MITKKKRLTFAILIPVTLLLVPLIAMQFTTEVNWNLMDFIIAGAILFGASLGIEFILRKLKSKKGRIILTLTLLTALFLIWIELAVGIFSSPLAGS